MRARQSKRNFKVKEHDVLTISGGREEYTADIVGGGLELVM